MKKLPFTNGDIITIDKEKYQVSISGNTGFCNLYKPGKSLTYKNHLGQLFWSVADNKIRFYLPSGSKEMRLQSAHYTFDSDLFFAKIDYPGKPPAADNEK